MDIKERINEKITQEFVISLMQEFGSDYKTFGNDIRFLPVCHGGDKYTLVYYDDRKLFNCLTHCGYMNIIDLVSKVKGIEWKDSVRFLCNKLGINSNQRVVGIQKNTRAIEKFEAFDNLLYSGNRPVNVVYDEYDLEYFDHNTFYRGWIDEGISVKSMEKFDISWYEYRKWIIIPCRDINGNLIGARRRTLDPDDENKYMPLFFNKKDYAFSTGVNLYGIYENQEIIRRKGTVVIFEGEKSVMKADTMYGSFPSLATYGSNVSNEQILQLIELGIKEVILAYDFDGHRDLEKFYKIKKKIEMNGIKCSVCYRGYENLDKHDAPIDKGKEVFEDIIRRRFKK